MSLPDAWVDRIFDKLNLTYGHQFLARWDGLPVDKVKADWAHELRFLQQNPGAITYALENLPPGRPPNVLEFRALCNSPHAPRAPERLLALTNYAETELEREQWRHIERLRQVKRDIPNVGECAWAFALELKDKESPHKVSPLVRSMYREVLGNFRMRSARPARTNGLPEPTTGERHGV